MIKELREKISGEIYEENYLHAQVVYVKLNNVKIYNKNAKWRSMGRAMTRISHSSLSGGIGKFMQPRKQKIGK